MNLQLMLDHFAGSLSYVQRALANVPEAQAADQPGGMMNHPAWTVAHLCVSHDFTLQCLEKPGLCPAEWARVAQRGTEPTAKRGDYPALAESLEVLARQHEAIARAARGAAAEFFQRPAPERVRAFAPTVGHIVSYMLMSHEHYHLGQIQVWKHLMGLAHPDPKRGK